MSTRLKEKREKIFEIIEQLREESANGTPIIVEGKKDVETLRALGVEGPILSVKTGGKSLVNVLLQIDETGASEIILLFDFDRRGKETTKRLRENLEKARINCNLNFWRGLHGLTGKDIQSIESLTAYLATLEKKIMQRI